MIRRSAALLFLLLLGPLALSQKSGRFRSGLPVSLKQVKSADLMVTTSVTGLAG